MRGVCGVDRALAGRQHLSRQHRRADRGLPAERRLGNGAGILREVGSLLKQPSSKAANPVIASEAKQSTSRLGERMDCFVASLTCANASLLSQAMTVRSVR